MAHSDGWPFQIQYSFPVAEENGKCIRNASSEEETEKYFQYMKHSPTPRMNWSRLYPNLDYFFSWFMFRYFTRVEQEVNTTFIIFQRYSSFFEPLKKYIFFA